MHTITVTATDDAGNSSTCTTTFTVVDATPPTVNCAPATSANADANCLAAIPNVLGGVTASDNCDTSLTLSQSPAAGTLVGLGMHTITVTATDDAGNSAACTTTFTVVDATPPTVNCPAGTSANADANCQAAVPNVLGGVTASDNCSAVTVTQSPAAGTSVGLGDTTVTLTVRDAAGNASTCRVTVQVVDTTRPVLGECPSGGPFLLNSGPQMIGPIGASDTCGLDATSSSLTATVDTSSVGTKTVWFTAVDTSGNSFSKACDYQVQYVSGGTCNGQPSHSILPPIKADGSSVFKKGRTVPVKFQVCDAAGNSIGTPGVVASFKLVQKWHGTVILYPNVNPDSTTPDNAFRWDAAAQEWHFNLSTKNLAAGYTYKYKIRLNDGTSIVFQFGLR